jgi:hypothetical protein
MASRYKEAFVKHSILIAAAALLAGAAVAQTSGYSATLAQPLAAKKEFIAIGNIWRCESTTCVLVSIPENPSSVRSCHALERLAGALTAYGTASQPFDADKLAKCNGSG